jgi:methionine biosynthesis protein MetW
MFDKVKRIWIWNYLFNYLFGDFPFAEGFGASLDYEHYWEELSKESAFLFPKFKLIADMIEPGSSVLDIGCGDGTLLQYLREKKDAKVKGIEISQKARELAKAKGMEVILADITKDNFKLSETFDYIILADVLEHLPNAEEVMLRLKGKSRCLLVILPNTGFLGDRLRLLLGRFPKQWVFHPSEHLRFWTLKDFRFGCEELGFQVKKAIGIPYYFYPFLNWFGLYRLLPGIFARSILYILLTPENDK